MKTLSLRTILLCLTLVLWTNAGIRALPPANADLPYPAAAAGSPEDLPPDEAAEDEAAETAAAEAPPPETREEETDRAVPEPEAEEETAEMSAEEPAGPAPAEEIADAIPAAAPDEDKAAGDGRYAALTLSPEELEELARLVWLEARGEPFEGQVAVAEVVLNRVLSPDFPDTVHDVIFQRGQFTPARRIPSVTPEEAQRDAVAAALDDASHVLSADVVYFSGAPLNDRVAAVIGSHYFCAA